MTAEKTKTTPAQLPVIIRQEKSQKSGVIRIEVPVSWEDFDGGIGKFGALAVAVENCIEALVEENTKRASTQKEEPKIEAETVKQFSCDDCDDLICTEPRKTASGEPRYWSYKGACGNYKAPKEKEEQSPAPASATPTPSGEIPEAPKLSLMTVYKGQYGPTTYLNQDILDDALAWLISIPKELRGRKTAEPKKSKNEKYLFINDLELGFLTEAVEAQGFEVKEGR